MRRYSQKNSLVTLSDINLTPMLDLAFVLLIIFVIATPLLEQGMKLDLPEGGAVQSQRDEVKKTMTGVNAIKDIVIKLFKGKK